MTRNLPGWASLALWVGAGAFGGLAVGALVSDMDRAFGYAPIWLLSGIAYFGTVLVLLRRRAPQAPAPRDVPPAAEPAPPREPPKPTRAAPARKPAKAGLLDLRFEFPDIPRGFPPVVGENEPIRVRLHVAKAGEPAGGAAVRLFGALRDGARVLAGEGVAGAGGTVDLTLKPWHTGELLLDAEASLDHDEGGARASLGIVRYDEEIARLFNEFRAYAVGVLGPESEADTARELAEKLRRGADAASAKALLELARVYELVAYGERPADRRLYLALVGALLVLEGATPQGSDEPPLAVEG